MKAYFFIKVINKRTKFKTDKEIGSHDLNTNDLEIAKRRTMKLAKECMHLRRHIKRRPRWRYYKGNVLAVRAYYNEDDYFQYHILIHITKETDI